MASNPRSKNGNLRRKHRARFKAMGAPCGICHGKYGPIHYDEPSDSKHPLSFVIDEIIPVSRYRLGEYGSAEECANDWGNLRAAHYICNSKRGNKPTGGMMADGEHTAHAADKTHWREAMNASDGEW